ncbi:MAG: YeeE/YedE family protein [Thermoleophilia bacterium]|nr:YeeE/YedE family protein [Thermoleophilia bacterium]
MAEAKSDRFKIYSIAIVVFLAIISILYYISAPVYLYIVAYMWFGFIFGILQQYGRFCFASAWRDLIMVKVPRMFVGIMVGMMTFSIIAVFIFTYYPERYHTSQLGLHGLIGGLLFGLGMVFAGGCATGSLYKTGEGNMISLVVLLALSFSQAIFAVTVFDSIFERFIQSLPSFSMVELLFGKPAGVPEGTTYHVQYGDYSFWQHMFADAGINAILIGVILLIGVYIIVVRKGFLKRRAATMAASADGGEVKMGFKDELAGFWHMISSSKRTSIAAILIGIAAATMVFSLGWMAKHYDFNNFGNVLVAKPASAGSNTVSSTLPASQGWPDKTYPSDVAVRSSSTVFDPGYWYITTQEAMAAAWSIKAVGLDSQPADGSPGYLENNHYFGDYNGLPVPWHSPALLLSFGLILGASFRALRAREFKWKFPTKELFIYAVIGGTLMGIGARIALGCNIGAFYAPAAFGDPSGWVFFIGMGIGAYLAAKFVNFTANRKMADMDFDIEL